jgi:Cu/Ag efflux protein CusF
MKHSRRSWLVVLTLTVLLPGCKGESTDKPKGESANEYDVKGKVLAVDPKKPAVTLDHEDIPGLMKAMEMEFEVDDGKILKGIKVGDQVKGRLKKTDSGYLITQLAKR